MSSLNIKCRDFCLYNKELFCPFYKDCEFPAIEISSDIIPDEIKSKKKPIKPCIMKKKQWMSFDFEINFSQSDKNFKISCEGQMSDLNFGFFSGTVFSDENYQATGAISTTDKNCDFGGYIEIDFSNTKLKGFFNTNYKSGGFSSNKKSYSGFVEFDNNIKTPISFYTDM